MEIEKQFTNIKHLIEAKLKSIARNVRFEQNPLFFVVKTVDTHDKFEIADQQGAVISLVNNQLQSLFQNFKFLVVGQSIRFDSYEIDIKFKDNVQIQRIKLIVRTVSYGINYAKRNRQFFADFSLNQFINTLSKQSRNYLNRIKKARALKNFNSPTQNILSFISTSERQQLTKKNDIKQIHENLGTVSQSDLSEQSLKILKKIVKVTTRNDLFNIVLSKNLAELDSKRIIRRMIFPDNTNLKTKDEMHFQKKTYSKAVIHQLIQQYQK